jgi:hypothetical protein
VVCSARSTGASCGTRTGGQVVSTAFDGSYLRPVLEVGPDYSISFFDATPGALGTGD